MRSLIFSWILFGILIRFSFPARAEFNLDQISVKIGSIKGAEIEKDLYFYSDWNLNHFNLDLTNKFSWPENNENFSKFNLKAGFENLKQLDLELDYQWNERYRILAPEIAYDFRFKPGLTIRLEYDTENRAPVLDKDEKLKYRMETGTVKMGLDKKNWCYDLKLAQTRKNYPLDENDNYTKNQLNHDLAWLIRPEFKINLSYYETTGFYPNDIKIAKDYWSSKGVIDSEYHFNDQWQITGSFGIGETEKGLIPYLDQQELEFHLKNKPSRNVTIDWRVSATEFNYYSAAAYFDPDGGEAEDDPKSRIENKMAVECYWRLKELNLELESGLFWASKDYTSLQLADLKREGVYISLGWKPRKIGMELEIAPDGNLWRVNGYYQLRLAYYF